MAKLADRVKEVEAKMNSRQTFTRNEVAEMIAASTQLRSYYPEVARLFGDKDIAVFLNQVEYYWNYKKRNKFYKYIEPCESARVGDSWMEDLVMTIGEFRKVMGVVCTRATTEKEAIYISTHGTTLDSLVVRKKDHNGKMWWYFNEKLFQALRMTALEGDFLADDTNSLKEQVPESQDLTSSIYTEQTSKTTKREETFYGRDESEEKDVNEVKKKRKEVKDKANKTSISKAQQLAIAELKDKRAAKMPLDFSINSSILVEAREDGFIDSVLDEELPKFIYYFTNGKGSGNKSKDWNRYFIDIWLRKEWIKKDELRKDANAERHERVAEILRGDPIEWGRGKSLDDLLDIRLRKLHPELAEAFSKT